MDCPVCNYEAENCECTEREQDDYQHIKVLKAEVERLNNIVAELTTMGTEREQELIGRVKAAVRELMGESLATNSRGVAMLVEAIAK